MSGNLTKHHSSGPGAAKGGAALLSGLLRCGRCGRKLHVGYVGKGGLVSRYLCRATSHSEGTEPCTSFGGLRVDEAVVDAVLEALQPLGVEASMKAVARDDEAQSHKRKMVELSLQRASYEVDRARQQYDAVDPRNRLVAAALEARWNEALVHLSDLQKQLDELEARSIVLSEDQQRQLISLGADLKAVWQHPAAPIQLKKRILRTVLNEIVVETDSDSANISLRLHWAGGAHTALLVERNQPGHHRHVTDKAVVDVVKELAEVCDDRAIASILNQLGYRTGAENRWTEARVKGLRDYRHIPVFDAKAERAWITLSQAAEELRVSSGLVRKLIANGSLPAKQVVARAPVCINRSDLLLAEVQRQVQAVRAGKRLPRSNKYQSEMHLL
jgi:excisionase family DNA binding protein